MNKKLEILQGKIETARIRADLYKKGHDNIKFNYWQGRYKALIEAYDLFKNEK